MIPQPPPGWWKLQAQALSATDPKKLARIISRMNAMLAASEKREKFTKGKNRRGLLAS